MSRLGIIRAIWLALLVFLLTTAIYLVWPTKFYLGDGIQALVDIESDVTGTRFFHPSGQLVYDPNFIQPIQDVNKQSINARYFWDYPASTIVYRIWERFGYTGSVITPLLVFRAIVGGLGVMIFFLAIYELRNSRLIAFLVSIALGTTAAYWTFSTEFYQSINMVTLIALAFYVLVRLGKKHGTGLLGKILLAVILAVATLFNIMAVLTVFPFVLAVAFLSPDQKFIHRIREIIITSVVYAVVIIVGITITYAVFPNTEGQLDLFSWSDSSGTQSQDVFSVEVIPDVVRAGLGFGKSQVLFPGIIARDFQSMRNYFDNASTVGKVVVAGFYGVVLLILMLPAIFLVYRRRLLPSRERWLWVMLPIWFLTYVAFNWFWLPSDVHYWIVPLMCWWTIVAVFLSHIMDTLPRHYRNALVATLGFVAVCFILNFTGQFLPQNRDRNPWLEIAEVASETPSNTLFISDGHPLDFYIAYFAHRNIVGTSIVNMQSNDDLEHLKTILSNQIEQHRQDNGTIYVYTDNPDQMVDLMGLTSTDQLEVEWTFPELTIYKANFPPTEG